MDLAISNWFFNTFGKNKVLTMMVRIVTELGSAWFIIACVAVLLIFKKTRKVGLFALFACGFPLSAQLEMHTPQVHRALLVQDYQ